jgi:hypothetical protein
MKKIILWAVLLFVVFSFVTKPASSAKFAHSAYTDLSSVAHTATQFVKSL